MLHLSQSHAGCVGCPVDIKRLRLGGGKLRSRRSGRSIACLIAVASALFMANARANLWGYLDEQGVAHFATEKLDKRYQLFSKARPMWTRPRELKPKPLRQTGISRALACIST